MLSILRRPPSLHRRSLATALLVALTTPSTATAAFDIAATSLAHRSGLSHWRQQQLCHFSSSPSHADIMGRDQYNRLLEGMLPYHNNFRRTLQYLSQTSESASHLSLKELKVYASRALQLVHHLEAHHTIEETYIFPLLALRQPQFAAGSEHVREHETMHSALMGFAAFFQALASKLETKKVKELAAASAAEGEEWEWPRDVYDEVKATQLIQELKGALLPHLEHEEDSLKAENIKKAGWTLQELSRIPM